MKQGLAASRGGNR